MYISPISVDTIYPVKKECQSRQLAIFCSSKCPGGLIIDAVDFCRSLVASSVTVISGFHSPVEKQCLRILIRSKQPVIWCLARGKMSTIPAPFREALAAGRLQILAPFSAKIRRQTASTCARRNRIVADMADAVLIIHAAAGSKVEALSREALAAGKRLYAFDHPANADLITAGANPIRSLRDMRL